jgi:hypothetical protein
VPGIIYLVYFVFVTQAVALHNESGGESRRHSELLVKGRWWKRMLYSFAANLPSTLLALFLFGLVGFVVAVASIDPHSVILASLKWIVQTPPAYWVFTLSTSLIGAVFISISAFLMTALYYGYLGLKLTEAAVAD